MLYSADDTSFNRLVLKAALPTVALFLTPGCVVCEACLAVFTRLAQQHREQVRLVTLMIDESQVVADSFGVDDVPAYLLFRDGELAAHGLGYVPAPLLDLFFRAAADDAAWPPTEQQIEDVLILPLLQHWGWSCRRQYQLPRRGAHGRRGAVDMLVALGDADPTFILFENKRRIADQRDLRRAVDQALGYAQALELSSFVVADAANLWLYDYDETGVRLARKFTWLDIERDDAALRLTIEAIAGVA